MATGILYVTFFFYHLLLSIVSTFLYIIFKVLIICICLLNIVMAFVSFRLVIKKLINFISSISLIWKYMSFELVDVNIK